jgi:hypothetical protein
MNDAYEHRSVIELRAAGRSLTGYCAVFNSPTRIGGFTESIRSGAFAASLADHHDILALVDHDASRLLGRTRSGTLHLSEDSRGLHFDIVLPNTSLGADVLELAQRGDIGGASFSFRATDEHWTGTHRELRAVDIYEVSIVQSFAAYADTSVYARSRTADIAVQRTKLRRLLLGAS